MAGKLDIRPTRLSDIWEFERMRDADAVEVMASGGYDPVTAVLESWAGSRETWTALFNGEVGCAFGVAPHPAGTALTPAGVIWLLTTDTVDKHPITFVRYSKKLLKDLSKRYGLLVNYVDGRHTRALNWAERIGFTVHPPIKFGRNGELFHPIVYEA